VLAQFDQKMAWIGSIHGLGLVGFNDTVMGWVQRLREMRTTCKTLHFIPIASIKLVKEIVTPFKTVLSIVYKNCENVEIKQ